MDEDQSTRLIKKYKNRRLYDLSLSQYITMDDLRNYVLQNIDFKVIDASTSKDLTSLTLMQLFVEMEANSTQLLSSVMLRQLIVMSQHPMSCTYKSLLENMFLSLSSQLNPILHEVQQKTTALWSKQSEQLLKSWQDLFHGQK